MPWAKGQSGNPGGRPRLAQSIRRRAQGDMDEAYETLLAVMRDSEKGSERAAAATTVLKLAGAAMAEEKAPAPENEPEGQAQGMGEVDLEAAAARGSA
jgi:hypothetical protein